MLLPTFRAAATVAEHIRSTDLLCLGRAGFRLDIRPSMDASDRMAAAITAAAMAAATLLDAIARAVAGFAS